ncbi:MAG: pilus assembly protein PilM [Candidatus Andersenbacteria bacterium]|nr:pilus assembly protein PilM [Candidatus Andersenbacteria bacterium]MBI3250956.1 pilus assembly protein PilM [Candidatus Andersenbacteria bacterium]
MIGIDISDRSIKIVWLTNTKPQEYVAHYLGDMPKGIMENGMILDKKQLEQALRQALAHCKIPEKSSETFVFSIPETQSFLRVLEVPAMEEDEISEAIRWEVAQHIPIGIENMYIDWQPIISGIHKTGSGKQEIQVGTAQRKIVDSLYSLLEPFQFDVAAFELESQAIVRSLISEELRARQGIVIIDLGGTATNVIIHDHGAMRFTASLERGLFAALSVLTEDEQKSLGDYKTLSEDQQQTIAAKLAPVSDELAVEVGSIAEFYGSIDTQHEVKEIILTGGGSNLPTLEQAFLRHFDNVHMQRGNPWVNVVNEHATHRLPVELTDSVRYSTALGLALRPVIL